MRLLVNSLILMAGSVIAFGLSLAQYMNDAKHPPQVHAIDGRLTGPLREVQSGKSGVKHVLEMSTEAGVLTAIIPGFELHSPDIRGAIHGLSSGAEVTMYFDGKDVFPSTRHVRAIRMGDTEILPLGNTARVERKLSRRGMGLSIVMGMLGIALFVHARKRRDIDG